jgi:tripartite-type tricarboxylate transporter receptor subunit TctC
MHIPLTRRQFALRALPALASAAVMAPSAAQAQGNLPEAARLLHGYPPGGSVDAVSRKLAEKLAGSWARTVVVDGKPGAAGRLAVEALKTAAPDGQTLLVTPGSVVMMYPHIYKNLGYDVFADLAPVGIVAVTDFALVVGPAVPATVRSVNEFVAWCKANPAQAQCGNAGAGSLPHFMATLLARELNVELAHIPYRGGGAAIQAAAAGEVAAAIGTESSAQALHQAGKVRVLATSGRERSVFFPQAPCFAELGLARLVQREWFAAFMRAGAPAAKVAAVSEALRSTLREADVREAWHRLALSAESSSAAELQQALRRDHDFWGPVIRASGFTPEA